MREKENVAKVELFMPALSYDALDVLGSNNVAPN
jgi:hypothetical protein